MVMINCRMHPIYWTSVEDQPTWKRSKNIHNKEGQDQRAMGRQQELSYIDQLVLNIGRKDNNYLVRTDHPTLIPQVEGGETLEDPVKYSFENKSCTYWERCFLSWVEFKSKEQIKLPEARHICTLVLQSISTSKKLIWPKTKQVQSNVIENVKIFEVIFCPPFFSYTWEGCS